MFVRTPFSSRMLSASPLRACRTTATFSGRAGILSETAGMSVPPVSAGFVPGSGLIVHRLHGCFHAREHRHGWNQPGDLEDLAHRPAGIVRERDREAVTILRCTLAGTQQRTEYR